MKWVCRGVVLVSFAMGVAGCGDRIATREITITQEVMALGQWNTPIALDVSEVPGAEVERSESQDWGGSPVSHVRIATTQPIKLMLVPVGR